MNIKDNSKDVLEGDIFVAIGKGHNYILEAIEKGASKIIANKGKYAVETFIVENTHKYLVNYLKENYYEDIKDIKLIGITGTNGKTTTAYLIYQALNKLNIKCAYIGTIGFYMNGFVKSLRNTTPDILEIYNLLMECKENDIEYVVMEASSHGLDGNRLDGLKFKYAIFTNLTSEHMDYHKTMEHYCLAKQKLFDMSEVGIINIDDEYASYFFRQDNITYGLLGDYKLEEYKVSLNNLKFKVNGESYKSKLIGKHNIYNLLAVISLVKVMKLDSKIIEVLTPPVGRMDIVRKNNNLIIVDYAHTPDATSKIINSVKELNPNKIITIIGCGGDRDRYKRPIMGKIATDNSDYVIFTNDNPRGEKPKLIVKDMLQSVDNKNYKIILNRKKAIIKGIQMLNKNDILLVLGKGHESYQIIGNKRYDFNDKKIIEENI